MRGSTAERSQMNLPLRVVRSDRPQAETWAPDRALRYPEFRYMGSKHRLLPWLHSVLDRIDFESALDPFCGSGCVAYLIKSMGRRVVATDFLNFPSVIAKATIENNSHVLEGPVVKRLLASAPRTPSFIEDTYAGIFYTREDLRFLDRLWHNLRRLEHPHHRAMALAAVIRSCLKKQPRGVFTVSGDLASYDDGRRDLRLSLEEHFLEQIEIFNALVFHNGRRNRAERADVFEVRARNIDLVYLDPPYVPRSDDNCYVKRYHFLEGLSCYWEGMDIDYSTKVRKIPKRYTPFSYRRTAEDAFDRMFRRFRGKKIVLSYSSNGFPDLERLVEIMGRYKKDVSVYRKPHRYHFGTRQEARRNVVEEYLIVGI